MLKITDLINRVRHNRGFGVQSPSAFYFVTQVLKEKLPYYAYSEIDKAAKNSPQGKEYYRRLFRIANFLRPKNIIIISKSETALTTLSAARHSAIITTIKDGETALLQQALQEQSEETLIYIGECESYAHACETAIAHAKNSTTIIVESIHATPHKAQWWEGNIKNPRTIVTYDLYSAGILFFDTEKQKQHYTLKM